MEVRRIRKGKKGDMKEGRKESNGGRKHMGGRKERM